MLEIKPRQTMRGHTGSVRCAVHLPDKRRIISSSNDGTVRLWDLKSGAQIGNNWSDRGQTGVCSIALSPNGKAVASGSQDGKMRLWDIKTETVVARWVGHADYVRAVCWSADGERVMSGSNDGTVRICAIKSSETILGPIKTGHEVVSAAIYSPDNTKIGTGGYNENALKIWDAKTWELLITIKHDSMVWSLAWTSDQKMLITGDYDGSIRIFDTATWEQIAILGGHTDTVYALSLFQNDRLLASASEDKTARLWNLDTSLPVSPPLQHKAFVHSAAISADGKLLVTGCSDGDVYVWEIHTILRDAGLEDLLSIPDMPQNRLKRKVTLRKSLMDIDATRRSAKLERASGVSDDMPEGVQFSATPSTSSAPLRNSNASSLTSHSHPPLRSISSLTRLSQPNTHEATALQPIQRRSVLSHHRPRAVEVAAAQDRKSSYVTRRPEQSDGKGKESQAQASALHTSPAAASTSTRPPPPNTITTLDAAGMQSQPVATGTTPPWWARFVCCASVPEGQ